MRYLNLAFPVTFLWFALLSLISITAAFPRTHRYPHSNIDRAVHSNDVGEDLESTNGEPYFHDSNRIFESSSLMLQVTTLCLASIVSAGTHVRFNGTTSTQLAPHLTSPAKIKWQEHGPSSAHEDQHLSSHVAIAPQQYDPMDSTSVAKNEMPAIQGNEIETNPIDKPNSSSILAASYEGGKLSLSSFEFDESYILTYDAEIMSFSASETTTHITKTVQLTVTTTASCRPAADGAQYFQPSYSSLGSQAASQYSFESPSEAHQTLPSVDVESILLPILTSDKDALKALSVANKTLGIILTTLTSSSRSNEVSSISSSAPGLKVSIPISSIAYHLKDASMSSSTLAGISSSEGSAKSFAATSLGSSLISISASSRPATSTSLVNTTSITSYNSTQGLLAPIPSIKYASSRSIPSVRGSKLQGSSSNDPSSQYVQWKDPQDAKLPSDLLVPGVNGNLTTEYGISEDTGILEMNSTTEDLVANINGVPHISRDGGKGGYLNGQKLFIFCDSGSYSGVTKDTLGTFLGFVSSSVAIDKGSHAKFGKPIVIEDGVAQWSDNNGRMRGFSPLTEGEQSYNLVMQGAGHRYAIWPESSLISYNATMAIIYAPIVYLNVDMTTKSYAYTYTGSTLLAITAQAQGGPIANRIVSKLFDQDEVEWGTIGGIRSWGPSGVGGNDGMVYVLGCVTTQGLLVGRVDTDKISDKSSVCTRWYSRVLLMSLTVSILEW
jgi:hypothetical protein